MYSRFLNVDRGYYVIRVDVAGAVDSKGVCEVLKATLGDRIPVRAEEMRLLDKNNNRIDAIPDEYFTAHGPSIAISYAQKIALSECQSVFFNYVAEATESERWIRFQYSPGTVTPYSLYVRDCFEKVITRILYESTRSVITSYAGVGKSSFLVYLLHRLVKSGRRVLYIQHPSSIYFDGLGGVFQVDKIPLIANHEFWNMDLWCLFNAKDRTHDDLRNLPYNYCRFVLCSSPNRSLVKGFKKYAGIEVFPLPVWSEAELEEIAEHEPSVAERLRVVASREDNYTELNIHYW